MNQNNQTQNKNSDIKNYEESQTSEESINCSSKKEVEEYLNDYYNLLNISCGENKSYYSVFVDNIQVIPKTCKAEEFGQIAKIITPRTRQVSLRIYPKEKKGFKTIKLNIKPLAFSLDNEKFEKSQVELENKLVQQVQQQASNSNNNGFQGFFGLDGLGSQNPVEAIQRLSLFERLKWENEELKKKLEENSKDYRELEDYFDKMDEDFKACKEERDDLRGEVKDLKNKDVSQIKGFMNGLLAGLPVVAQQLGILPSGLGGTPEEGNDEPEGLTEAQQQALDFVEELKTNFKNDLVLLDQIIRAMNANKALMPRVLSFIQKNKSVESFSE